MAKGVAHYKKDGTLHTGGTHKMPDGSLHSGKTHGKTSVKLFHLNELSKPAKEKAMKMYGGKQKAKTTPKKKAAAKPRPMKRGKK